MSAKVSRLRALRITLIDIESIEDLRRDWYSRYQTSPPDVINRLSYIKPEPTITIRLAKWVPDQKIYLIDSITFPAVHYDGRDYLAYKGKRSGRIEHFLDKEGKWTPIKSRRWPKTLRYFLEVIKMMAEDAPIS